ncbi:MAG TPA: helix-turn-helix transcriptional regulator [Vicinamibacterales bacterium]|jgi:DNA-binding PadR family transcriptional regulator|nr:helix-turn-helix transcriptional regulator [Vicinamibacterales bacterium]
MPTAARLGEVEQLVLLAVLRLDADAYAVPIRDLIARECGVALSRGSIYVTLERLEAKGLVASWFSEPTGEPGGKARRLFRTLPAGVQALKSARRAVDRLAAGTILARRG